MPHGFVLTDDLIFASRIMATARAAGKEVVQAKDVASLRARLSKGEPASCLILDLQVLRGQIQPLLSDIMQCCPRPRVVAYGSHVDVESLKAARDAGCDVVLPRSVFVERMEADLPSWFTQTF